MESGGGRQEVFVVGLCVCQAGHRGAPMLGTPLRGPAAAVALLLSRGKPSVSVFSPILSPARAPAGARSPPAPSPGRQGDALCKCCVCRVQSVLLLLLLPCLPLPHGGLASPGASPGVTVPDTFPEVTVPDTLPQVTVPAVSPAEAFVAQIPTADTEDLCTFNIKVEGIVEGVPAHAMSLPTQIHEFHEFSPSLLIGAGHPSAASPKAGRMGQGRWVRKGPAKTVTSCRKVPSDLFSFPVSEDLCHQKCHSFTMQETERGCDPRAAVSSVCAVPCSSCSCPRLRRSLPKAYLSFTCSLTCSFPYPTHQALWAKSWAVFFPPYLCSPLPPHKPRPPSPPSPDEVPINVKQAYKTFAAVPLSHPLLGTQVTPAAATLPLSHPLLGTQPCWGQGNSSTGVTREAVWFPPKEAALEEGCVELLWKLEYADDADAHPGRVLAVSGPGSSQDLTALLFSPDTGILMYNHADLMQRNSEIPDSRARLNLSHFTPMDSWFTDGFCGSVSSSFCALSEVVTRIVCSEQHRKHQNGLGGECWGWEKVLWAVGSAVGSAVAGWAAVWPGSTWAAAWLLQVAAHSPGGQHSPEQRSFRERQKYFEMEVKQQHLDKPPKRVSLVGEDDLKKMKEEEGTWECVHRSLSCLAIHFPWKCTSEAPRKLQQQRALLLEEEAEEEEEEEGRQVPEALQSSVIIEGVEYKVERLNGRSNQAPAAREGFFFTMGKARFSSWLFSGSSSSSCARGCVERVIFRDRYFKSQLRNFSRNDALRLFLAPAVLRQLQGGEQSHTAPRFSGKCHYLSWFHPETRHAEEQEDASST
ncbi:hypothetical protein IHE44_0001344 [Lamprotornis superbus]|uniref:Uncharacterized protein n=1 Tax=Lamprotornis superbus TaxID=245042 RepID=A0A835TNT3_9PASS|nr:hypothetical protein IHE44_0001344 [Lamprotornis superbus]